MDAWRPRIALAAPSPSHNLPYVHSTVSAAEAPLVLAWRADVDYLPSDTHKPPEHERFIWTPPPAPRAVQCGVWCERGVRVRVRKAQVVYSVKASIPRRSTGNPSSPGYGHHGRYMIWLELSLAEAEPGRLQPRSHKC